MQTIPGSPTCAMMLPPFRLSLGSSEWDLSGWAPTCKRVGVCRGRDPVDAVRLAAHDGAGRYGGGVGGKFWHEGALEDPVSLRNVESAVTEQRLRFERLLAGRVAQRGRRRLRDEGVRDDEDLGIFPVPMDRLFRVVVDRDARAEPVQAGSMREEHR